VICTNHTDFNSGRSCYKKSGSRHKNQGPVCEIGLALSEKISQLTTTDMSSHGSLCGEV
jgi:hypothetical protein